MEEKLKIEYLFDVIKQIKHFYESPVIYVTYKDYSDIILKTLCAFHDALQRDNKQELADIILDFHLQWLHTVRDIEEFIKALEIDFPRGNMERLISYTITTLDNRLKNYNKYIDTYKYILDHDNQSNLQSEVEIIEEMHREVIHSLEKQNDKVSNCKSELEYRSHVNTAAEELLQWVDKATDELAVRLSTYLTLKEPIVSDLTKPLQKIVFDLKSTKTESAQKMLDDLRTRGSDIGSMIRSTTGHVLESSKVVNKITILEDRIKRLEAQDKDKPSAALLALKRKRDYLVKRLDSIENLKTTLQSLQNVTSVSVEDIPEEELCVCEDFFNLRIFNHLLPAEQREQLITELCSVWDLAIFDAQNDKSMISILSAVDTKEEFTDELGTFYIDEYSRRIYKFPDDDERYLPNEHNELVRVSDDQDHIYFYDECGRYFIDGKTRQRVYKAHSKASEYMMDSSGVLLKIKEVKDNVTYYYDNYGRYFIDKEGKHIYQDADSLSKYENDGLGNLVRIRSHLDIFDPCPGDANVTEDFKYLKETVGKALRECIGRVLLQQPSDPIKYLAACLVKYRENIELRDKRLREKEELNVEREIAIAEEIAAAEKAAQSELHTRDGSEATYDSNLAKYSPLDPENISEGPTSTK